MGLDCSHDAFHGAYSAFNRFRQAVSRAAGGSYPPHYLYTASGEIAVGANGLLVRDESMDEGRFYVADEMTQQTHPGLWEFFAHSDCDGDITPDLCGKLADEMEALLPKLEAQGDGGGHIARDGGFGSVARRFIAGCRAAATSGEPLEFG